MDRFRKLKEDGIAHGMCDKFREEWKEPSVGELCRFFFRGMDFCIEHDWPSIEMVRKFFDVEELAQYGVHIEDGVANRQSNVCAMADAVVYVYVPDNGVCDVYARHDSEVHIVLGDGAFCYVTVLDNATVYVDKKGDKARLYASLFSGHIQQPELFNRIHNKEK